MKPLIMTAFDAARLAGELRDTADNLRLCLAELITEDRSLLADLLRHFPNQIETLANDLAERPSAEFAPAWPAWEASPEAHFAALMAPALVARAAFDGEIAMTGRQIFTIQNRQSTRRMKRYCRKHEAPTVGRAASAK